jgi:hypothetical protein
MILKQMNKIGIRSEHAYWAAFASIGLSMATWFMSKNKEKAGLDRADRWGIFVGTWAPTFFGLGNGLQYYEEK